MECLCDSRRSFEQFQIKSSPRVNFQRKKESAIPSFVPRLLDFDFLASRIDFVHPRPPRALAGYYMELHGK